MDQQVNKDNICNTCSCNCKNIFNILLFYIYCISVAFVGVSCSSNSDCTGTEICNTPTATCSTYIYLLILCHFMSVRTFYGSY